MARVAISFLMLANRSSAISTTAAPKRNHTPKMYTRCSWNSKNPWTQANLRQMVGRCMPIFNSYRIVRLQIPWKMFVSRWANRIILPIYSYNISFESINILVCTGGIRLFYLHTYWIKRWTNIILSCRAWSYFFYFTTQSTYILSALIFMRIHQCSRSSGHLHIFDGMRFNYRVTNKNDVRCLLIYYHDTIRLILQAWNILDEISVSARVREFCDLQNIS